ncbi:CPBP family intramembrane glutamic endopeptidase [Burkholderia dolosa]|uniref:CPBP family intramembrane glutamic endopeptidase n=1 Tax=Burkholderia dolosa TaxID=152500 RepID=UPI001590AAF6|nr:CPBP family intramembrane glutamic endopeptidase [Burkholderia dolosa]MBR8455713.1 CPBP family intramembrane metalloprotease [Burkholderia dolosa]MBY4751603.1 CPBP family intramembrane metalloprotease [Burkholderia dolosa]MDN7420152.1 CPBP family intramembrane metalloprotease [Burkholderia dolosa]
MKPFAPDPFLDLAYTGRYRLRDLLAALFTVAFVVLAGAFAGSAIEVFVIAPSTVEHADAVAVVAFDAVGVVSEWLGLVLAAKLVLKRPLSTFMHAARRFDFRSVVAGASIYMIVRVCYAAGAYALGPASPPPSSAIESPLPVAFVACGLMLASMQSVLEEIAVRGLLTQSIGVYVRNGPVLYTLVALLFASFHGWLGLPQFATVVAASLLMSALCSMDRGIAMPIGFHVAYNMSELLGFGFFGTPSGGSEPTAAARWCVAALHFVAAIVAFAATAQQRRRRVRRAPD